MPVTIREKVNGSGVWWVFINYKNKRKSLKIGSKNRATQAAKKLRAGMPELIRKPPMHKKPPAYKLNHSMSESIRRSLHGTKGGHHWGNLVNYTIDDLKKHLETQFKTGMCWANYGKWVIDHIQPLSSFRFTKPEDWAFQECWGLSNLQPLWAVENARKGSKTFALNCTSRAPNPSKSHLSACNY